MADPALPRSAAGPNSPWLLTVIVSIATFMEVLDTTIANVALRHIAGSLAASQDESTYIITSYLVSNAIVLPISGWLADVIGRKRFYMICVAIFTVSSVLCAFSTNLWEMLFFRVLQGIGGGGLAPVEQSIFADSFPPEKRAQAFAIYGFTVVTAPAIGPVLGGWLTDAYSWHWVFLINLPVGCLSLVLTYLFVYDSDQVKEDRRKLLEKGLKVDVVGAVFVVLGFGTLQLVLDRFEREDGIGSDYVNILGSICVVSIAFLILWEAYHPRPIMNVKLFASRAFAISNVVMFAFGFIIIATTQLIPQLTQELLGYDATTAGLTLGAAGIASIFIMPIAGIVTGQVVQPKWLVLMALAGTAFAMWHAAGIDLNVGFWNVSFLRVVQVVWLPFLFIPISAVSYVGVPPEKNNEASALINFMRNLGGSVGVSYTTTLLAYREQFHHARLAEHVTPYQGFASGGGGLGAIAGLVQTQASILSYLDLFIALAVVAAAVAPLALFLPKLPKGAPIGH